ncbi:MAG: LCP family protein [Coriobacteriia bacterium]|nr:LCP family protein [Coriobacteriia bacterium]
MGRRSQGRASKRDHMRHEQSFNGGTANSSRSASLSGDGSATKQVPASLLDERDRRRKKTKKRLLVAIGVVTAFLIAAVAAAGFYYMNLEQQMTLSDESLELLNVSKPDPGDPFNLLVLGIDKDFDAGWTEGSDVTSGERADAIILAHINPQTQEVWMVSIPRDTRVELPGYGPQKINAATVYGGTEMAIQAVKDVTGQEINYVMTVNFWGFENMIDAMGGVVVDVPVLIDDPKADATRPRRATRIEPGLQTLDGAHALTFARSRDSHPDADFGRARMQQLLFRSLIEQMGDVSVTQLPGLVNALAENVTTNLTPLELLQVVRDMRGTSSDNLHTITLPGEWHSPFVYLDEVASMEIWHSFGVESFPEEDENGESELLHSEISVTVRNGTARVGIGSEAASVLQARGFFVEDIGNTEDQFEHEENLVVYRDNRDAAAMVARYLPAGTQIVQGRGMFNFETDVLVIVGVDWNIETVPATSP